MKQVRQVPSANNQFERVFFNYQSFFLQFHAFVILIVIANIQWLSVTAKPADNPGDDISGSDESDGSYIPVLSHEIDDIVSPQYGVEVICDDECDDERKKRNVPEKTVETVAAVFSVLPNQIRPEGEDSLELAESHIFRPVFRSRFVDERIREKKAVGSPGRKVRN